MHQTGAPKKGRTEKEGGREAATLLKSYAGAPVEVLTPRLCPKSDHLETVALGERTGNRRNRQDGCLHKKTLDTRCQKYAINEPLALGERKPVLPLIKKGSCKDTDRAIYRKSPASYTDTVPDVVQDFGGSAGAPDSTEPNRITAPSNRNTVKSKDPSPTMNASSKEGKTSPLPILASDMTPWVRASPSESSLTSLLHRFPSPKMDFTNMAEPRPSERDLQLAVCEESWDLQPPFPTQPPPSDKTSSKVKQRGRMGVTKRRSFNKFHNMKLPPIPAVTELSFSRNFSFSFFELPQHQSLQYWLQRQRYVYMRMRQLE